jgi:hypothetical protein
MGLLLFLGGFFTYTPLSTTPDGSFFLSLLCANGQCYPRSLRALLFPAKRSRTKYSLLLGIANRFLSVNKALAHILY